MKMKQMKISAVFFVPVKNLFKYYFWWKISNLDSFYVRHVNATHIYDIAMVRNMDVTITLPTTISYVDMYLICFLYVHRSIQNAPTHALL